MKALTICALLALTAAPAQAAPIPLSTAERAAAFQAAGFRHWPEGWTRCREDASASHTYGTLKVADLNGDGAPEVWLRESSVCHGKRAEAVVLLTRKPAGWTVLLDEAGVAVERKTRTKGWPDIEAGGRVFRFNGTKYVRSKLALKK